MRANYVTMDKKKHPQLTMWCAWYVKPELDEDGQWVDDGRIAGDFTSITKAEAECIVGFVLKPGQVWDRRRNKITKG